ncbi:protein of unknown function [Methylocella tundrae]|uniref:Uncharacterized protein n=1 Tax=Methylocella tundrae TaxID=227605 RepID=A0A4U8YUW8_METTU|nr:protein of unknown function [Methylocella tundrae]
MLYQLSYQGMHAAVAAAAIGGI